MLKQKAKLFYNIAQLLDLVLVVCAFTVAYYIRLRFGPLDDMLAYYWVLLVVLPIWSFLHHRFNLYSSLRSISVDQLVISELKVHLYGAVLVAAFTYFFQPEGFSRRLFALFILCSLILLTSEKLAVKSLLSFIRSQGYNIRRILIVGDNDQKTIKLITLLHDHESWGLQTAGIVQPHYVTMPEIMGVPVIGSLDEIDRICVSTTVDEVIFCIPKGQVPDLEQYVATLEEVGIVVRMVLDTPDFYHAHREFSLFQGEIPLVTFRRRHLDETELYLKRCIDIIGALVGLALMLAMLPFIALAIKLDSPGPLFFGQDRVGQNGRIFTCWKFRSMQMDAEHRKQELQHLNEMSGAIFKIKNDPRITRIGHILRKLSIDELPQFWNVLRGEMSLVGTRPPTPDEVKKYEKWHHRRISIKPGITGLWQISGRSRINEFDEIVRLDLEYIDTWDVWLDVRILIKTIKVVFHREGSY